MWNVCIICRWFQNYVKLLDRLQRIASFGFINSHKSQPHSVYLIERPKQKKAKSGIEPLSWCYFTVGLDLLSSPFSLKHHHVLMQVSNVKTITGMFRARPTAVQFDSDCNCPFCKMLSVTLNVRPDKAQPQRCEATTSWKHLFKAKCVKSLWWKWMHSQPLHPIYTFTSNNLWVSS